MGCYVNPDDMSKEEWLKRNGVLVTSPIGVFGDKLLVCLVDNGPFTAAGVCFNMGEVEAFTQPNDMRLKKWYLVPTNKLREVSDLDTYLKG